jgi:hypothetical protein
VSQKRGNEQSTQAARRIKDRNEKDKKNARRCLTNAKSADSSENRESGQLIHDPGWILRYQCMKHITKRWPYPGGGVYPDPQWSGHWICYCRNYRCRSTNDEAWMATGRPNYGGRGVECGSIQVLKQVQGSLVGLFQDLERLRSQAARAE